MSRELHPRGPRQTGRVILIGAGPGDPELMTIKAVRALSSADVILHDDLVNPEILQWASPHARIVAVGKRGGCRSTPQEFIIRLAESEARKGHVVARLKGGDPLLFGRGGEEWQALTGAGIDVEVISGISAGVAAAASAGISLTHRDHSQGVILITGHGKDGAEPAWDQLARTGLTLVVYMGVARATAIRDALIDGGMALSTPVAIIQNASLPNERTVRDTLARFPEAMAASGIGSPAIIVIGDVADARMALAHAPDMGYVDQLARLADRR